MESDDYNHYQNYTGFTTSSRKNRSRRKRRPKVFLAATNNEDGNTEAGALETVADSNLSDENGSGGEEADDSNNDTNVDRSLDRNSSRVSLDAMMKALPSYEKDEVFEITNVENKAVESVVDKLNIEDETLSLENNVLKKQYSLINNRALPKEASTYELESFEKNALIIFNQKNIDGHLPRLGTEKDVDSLTKTFKNFGFEVTSHDDMTKDELFKELKAFSERDFTDYGCVAVAVLTHGSNNGLLRAKDQQYSEIEIINLFKDYSKPTLVTKPKLIIIQACRGTKIMQGVMVFQSGKIRKDHDEEDLEPYILPVESDLLILHSSYVGSPSHRNELYGSWFIQALCTKINTLASTHDLESIITEVKREVAINKQHEEYNKRTFEMDVNKQMPVMTSTLIRKLYLKRFGEQAKTVSYADQLRRPSESRHEVLDTVNSAPMTPLLVQFGPCSCFLDHFTYLRNCLRYFVEENPSDETAQNFLEVANAFEDGVEFNTPKDKMCKAISKHLLNNARCSQYYKYLYFYKTSQT